MHGYKYGKYLTTKGKRTETPQRETYSEDIGLTGRAPALAASRAICPARLANRPHVLLEDIKLDSDMRYRKFLWDDGSGEPAKFGTGGGVGPADVEASAHSLLHGVPPDGELTAESSSSSTFRRLTAFIVCLVGMGITLTPLRVIVAGEGEEEDKGEVDLDWLNSSAQMRFLLMGTLRRPRIGDTAMGRRPMARRFGVFVAISSTIDARRADAGELIPEMQKEYTLSVTVVSSQAPV